MEKDRIKKTFINLVEIDSPSGQESKIAEYIMNKMKSIGIDSKKDDFGNVLAFIEGQGKPLLLSSHMDTVPMAVGVKVIVEGDLIKTSGDMALGADDKAGITEILTALEFLKENKIKHRPLEIVFTCSEEKDLSGSKNLSEKFLKSKEGLVLDRSGEKEVVVIASPFITSLDIQIKGLSAHSSVPEKGISAIDYAVNCLSRIKKGRIDFETTSNIGKIFGGEAMNAVAENIQIIAEVRSHEKVKMEKIVNEYEDVFNKEAEKAGVSVEFSKKLECCGYKYHKTEPFIQKISQNWKKFGVEAIFEKTGGASDVNEFVRKGIMAVDIGNGGKNPHTSRETVSIEDMIQVSKFIIEFVRTN